MLAPTLPAVIRLMHLCGYLITTLPLGYIIYTALKRFWIYFIDKTGTYGSDLHNLKYWKKTRHKAYVFVDYQIKDTANWEEASGFIQAKLLALLQSPTSSLRLQINTITEKIEHNAQLKLEDIMEWCESDQTFYLFTDRHQRDLVIRVYPKKRCIAVLFDHTVFDGINLARDLAQPVLEYRPFSKNELQKDRYIPVFSELHQLYTLSRMVSSTLTCSPLPRYTQEQQTVAHHQFPFKDIKAIKTAYKSTFPEALLAHLLIKLFTSIDPSFDTLRIGIIVGFDNPRFRNNYSICRVKIKRSTSIGHYIYQIKQQIAKNKHETIPLYQIFSTHDFQTNFKYKMIDCLFSPLLFFPYKGLSRHMENTRFFTVPCTMPLYIFANAFGDTIYCATSINTPAINTQSYCEPNGELFTFTSDYTQLESRIEAPKDAHA